MTTSTTLQSRRTLVKGAAWSPPILLASTAIPVYAASKNYVYRLQLSSRLIYSGSNTGTRSSNITYRVRTNVPVSTNLPGVTVTYNGTEGVDTTATMNKLQYIVALPKGHATTFTVTNGAPWVYQGKSNPATIRLGNGTTVSAANYDVFTFTFTGQTRNAVVESAKKATWPGTAFDASSTTTSIAQTIPSQVT
ncbi:MAG: hypothetical protein Q3965_04250, partial [Rothia sp. (in: high G+C Gram-positive bacteria)]|nr:hypothetical protein [Rothia sp. (in: high G+C Gram-positive bacteria)]